MDVPLAGLLLSLATFVLGTITPFIYLKFFHEGLSIKPLDMRAITGLTGSVLDTLCLVLYCGSLTPVEARS